MESLSFLRFMSLSKYSRWTDREDVLRYGSIVEQALILWIEWMMQPEGYLTYRAVDFVIHHSLTTC